MTLLTIDEHLNGRRTAVESTSNRSFHHRTENECKNFAENVPFRNSNDISDFTVEKALHNSLNYAVEIKTEVA